MFLSLPGCTLSIEVTGKRVNRGAGYGLEIPANFHFYGPENAIVWIKSAITNIEKKLSQNVNRCLNRLNNNVFKSEKFVLFDQYFGLSAIRRPVIGEIFNWDLKMVSAIKCLPQRVFNMKV